MLPANSLYYILASSIAAGGVLIEGGRRLYNRVRRNAKQEVLDAMKDAFVVDMATNHLPHIYNALTMICKALDIELNDPPAISFVPLEGLNGTDSVGNTRRN